MKGIAAICLSCDKNVNIMEWNSSTSKRRITVQCVSLVALVMLLGVTFEYSGLNLVLPPSMSKLPAPDQLSLDVVSDDSMVNWLKIQTKRKTQIRKTCAKMKQLSDYKPLLSHERNKLQVVDPRNKIHYCAIPKCGSAHWRTVLLKRTGQFDGLHDGEHMHYASVMNRAGMKTFSQMKSDALLDVVRHYRKFIVVRDPFDRIVSAYRNKIDGSASDQGGQFKRHKKTMLRQRLNEHHELKSLHLTSNVEDGRLKKNIMRLLRKLNQEPVTFSEFVQHIASPIPSHVNGHWARYIDICHPCQIQYDYIIKLETVEEDTKHLWHILYGEKKVSQQSVHNNKGENGTSAPLSDKYINKLSSNEMHKLKKFLKWDIEMFGY